MKFTKASVEIIPIPAPTDTQAVYRHLERIGRTCYKSEDKITPESCRKFLQNIFNRKHWAMLEHYPFVIEDTSSDLFMAIGRFYEINDVDIQSKISYIKTSVCIEDLPNGGFKSRYLISGSATAFNYLMEALQMTKDNGVAFDDLEFYLDFMKVMSIKFPHLFKDPYPDDDMAVDTYERLSEGYQFLSQDDVLALNDHDASMHLYMTARFICDRGVTHEIVRHRPASYAQESTRYCNYGTSGCRFVIPNWFSPEAIDRLLAFDEDPFIVFNKDPLEPFTMTEWTWIQAMQSDENFYNRLIGEGWNPQQARSVLPNSVKTEIVMTANIPEWSHFFNMRVPKTAHPQMREVSIPLYNAARQIYIGRLPDLTKEAAE